MSNTKAERDFIFLTYASVEARKAIDKLICA
jgi:hypothetical protein